ncbi:MAG: monofunctional biosynthetic peptidoglycan transglycosylase [Gammaproteobacteria bacterium]
MPRKKSKNLARWIFFTLGALLLLSIIPVLLLRWVDPQTSSFMLQHQWAARNNQAELNYQWQEWNQISPQLKIAVVAAEDQNFPDHYGFDLGSIIDALQQRQQGLSSRGASTISQQVVKNLFLWSGQSWIRKGLEAWLTLVLETSCSKQRILEIYLNIAQWGSNQYGAQAASQYYFAKNAIHLNRYESALMAAVLPNPVLFHVDNPSSYTRERQSWILHQIRGLGGPSYLSNM